MKPEIDVRDDSVTIEGQLIIRPRRILRREWVEFWTCANGDALNAYDDARNAYDDAYTEGHEQGVQDTSERSYDEGYDQGYQDGLIVEEQP